ncbi:MAG: indole-3-glycerol phosphate synthase TrpC [Eubacteriaceae bacterium]|nr:indole-3-glycerol phosphate synthase TrpC [Eubacteriaceae bacterium]
MILDRINENKRKALIEEKARISSDMLWDMIEDTRMTKRFSKSLVLGDRLSIIAEVKKASPSKGLIRPNFDPVEIAREYEKSDIQAISVLTETDFFLGDKIYIPLVKENTTRPILRKDFILDPYQIIEAKVLGADAVLLIAASLTDLELKTLSQTARELGIEVLTEVHNKEELDRVLSTDAEIIGINNRDLNTFVTDIKTTEKLIEYIPKGKIVISESGIDSYEDMEYLRGVGVNGVLIGETFMRADSISAKIAELRGKK